MKTLLTCLLFLFCTLAHAFPDVKPAEVSPDKPKVGNTIRVTYNGGAPGAMLPDAKAIELHALVFRYGAAPAFFPLPMKQEGNTWTASLQLSDPKSCYAIFRFVSQTKADEGGESGVEAMVYGDDGKPVIGAHQSRGYFLGTGAYNAFKRTKDIAAANAEDDLEKELYPQNWRVWPDKLGRMLRDDGSAAGKEKIRPMVKSFADAFGGNEEAIPVVISWYKIVGDTASAVTVEQTAIAKNPKGDVARNSRWLHILDEKDAAKRVPEIQEFLHENQNLDKDDLRFKTLSLFNACVAAKEYDQAAGILSTIENPSWSWYNEFAWGRIEKGEALEKAIGWAQKGIELSKKPSEDEKRFYPTIGDWESDNKYKTGMVLDTYADGLLQLGRTEDAEQQEAEAFRLTDGQESEIADRYMNCMMKNKHYAKAYEVGLGCYTKGKSSDAMMTQLKLAYAQKEGGASDFGALSSQKQQEFNQLIAQAASSRSADAKKDAAQARINKPSVDFTLKNLEGAPVSLASLKGKVVIIDFWATWCGPCKASFPYLQKVYDKFKDNKNVVFLAVDTWERTQDVPSTVQNARKFLTDNKYTFPVLIDEISRGRVSEKYDVNGIPTKFLIDKKGNIAFKSIGFAGPKMEDELIAQIEILLAENVGLLR